MASSLSNLVDNFAKEIHKVKFKDCHCFLEYESVKENSVKYKCLSCNKDYSNNIDEASKKRFKNTFKFSNNYIDKFILLLKNVFMDEYVDDSEKFNKTTSIKEEFYSTLNMEDITDADYMYVKIVCKELEIKYHDL